MNFSLLKLHGQLIAIVLGLILLSLLFISQVAVVKTVNEIDWQDILGEGGICIITLVWIFFILISRPAGSVTNLLVIGLAFFHVSSLLDVLDEFFIYPSEHQWLSIYEAWPAPVGMVFMTIGLYFWHQEQLALNKQLTRRERYYREHSLSDYITGLYSAEYMNDQINREYTKAQRNETNFSILMLDMDGFGSFVRLYGDKQGDRLLGEIAELILMNIRTVDLACRYAGDRFVVLLPDVDTFSAREIAMQIQDSIAHLAFKPERTAKAIYHSISVSMVHSCQAKDMQSCFKQLNDKMIRIKAERAINKPIDAAATIKSMSMER
ncbi:diguanylate cyclase [Catenovulum sp. SM1970]|uniref:GGDEF domain-containing protein n=1 Tax=Marinifaba aquimaris TaxID=2741323 RepID=UPI0015747DE9|nr:diguanylate cyclase [Marinifaba aquimaris]NTS77626.1 diguanylate cyclase [Marinifaba aquimaris]